MAKNENTTDSLKSLQQSQPTLKQIQNPPRAKPVLADPSYPISLESARAIGQFYVFRDSSLNEANKYLHVTNAFLCSKSNPKYSEGGPEEPPIEKLSVTFVSFNVGHAEDETTRIVEKIGFRGPDIGSATRFVDAKEFLAATEVSIEAGSLALEAENFRKSQRVGIGQLVRM
jgi:hypothetical protein